MILYPQIILIVKLNLCSLSHWYWSHENDKDNKDNWNENQKLQFDAAIDGQWHNYVIPVGDIESWNNSGQINRFKIDPVYSDPIDPNVGSETTTVSIDYVKVMPEKYIPTLDQSQVIIQYERSKQGSGMLPATHQIRLTNLAQEDYDPLKESFKFDADVSASESILKLSDWEVNNTAVPGTGIGYNFDVDIPTESEEVACTEYTKLRPGKSCLMNITFTTSGGTRRERTQATLKMKTNDPRKDVSIPVVILAQQESEGIKPWDGEGVSAVWADEKGTQNVINGENQWQRDKNGWWEYVGEIGDDLPSWDGDKGVTGAWLGLEGNLNIASENKLWRKAEDTWTYIGDISDSSIGSNPFRTMTTATKPWDSGNVGITGLWLGTGVYNESTGEWENRKLNVMSKDRMWRRRREGEGWEWVELGPEELSNPANGDNPFKGMPSTMTKPWEGELGITALWQEEGEDGKFVLNVMSGDRLWRRVGGSWEYFENVSVLDEWKYAIGIGN